MVPGINSPMAVYTEVPQPGQEKNNCSSTQQSSAEHSSTERLPLLPQHRLLLPNSGIRSVPIALAPTILPLTYDPNSKKKHDSDKRRRHVLCQCRVFFTLIFGFLLLFLLIHYIAWICLNKDKDETLFDFIMHWKWYSTTTQEFFWRTEQTRIIKSWWYQ